MSTGISWTDEVWNPVTGCSRVSEGCRNCYAAALAPRLAAMGQKGYTALPWTKANAPENVHLHPDRLEKPLHWRKPRRVFVNSMSDLFHELVPDRFVDRVFGMMALAEPHTFQVLTKRPERMAEYLGNEYTRTNVEMAKDQISLDLLGLGQFLGEWPLPNVWLGTSVEDQKAADERIPHLRRCPAAVRFLSCEPLLGPLWLYDTGEMGGNVLFPDAFGDRPGVQWVIVGGESGPNFRTMDHDWARSIRDQCKGAGVAFFGKQDSGHRNEKPLPEDLRIHEFPEGVMAF